MTGKMLLAAGLLTVAALAGAPAAQATFPGRDGSLVVERMVGNKQPDLFLMRPDGTGAQRLTASGAWEEKPEWSADGAQIMYSRWRPVTHQPGVFDIGLSAMDASARHQRVIVPPSPRDVVTQDWSPDGRRILLEIATGHPNGRQGHGARQSDLAVVDADGSHFRRLTRTAAIESMAVWSPDGKRIAFASDRQVKGKEDLPRGGRAFEIYTMSANGIDIRRITHNHVPDLYPTWQPLRPWCPVVPPMKGTQSCVDAR
ncbi:MAG TPA: hypothetical protein VHW04_14335 [Solirubrobacteraceae bacterium]|jgi:Tol biopolymer transport system component|nr:hypothetical protein [Solirubrobacteraceae bacterium]